VSIFASSAAGNIMDQGELSSHLQQEFKKLASSKICYSSNISPTDQLNESVVG